VKFGCKNAGRWGYRDTSPGSDGPRIGGKVGELSEGKLCIEDERNGVVGKVLSGGSVRGGEVDCWCKVGDADGYERGR
jgi:hypothetical protein